MFEEESSRIPQTIEVILTLFFESIVDSRRGTIEESGQRRRGMTRMNYERLTKADDDLILHDCLRVL